MAVGFAVSCLAMSFPVFLVPCTVKGLRYDNICLGFFFFFNFPQMFTFTGKLYHQGGAYSAFSSSLHPASGCESEPH